MLLRELAKLSPANKKAEIDRMVERSKKAPNGQKDRILGELEALELKHNMTTAEMFEGLKSGKVQEDFEVVRWMMLANLTGK